MDEEDDEDKEDDYTMKKFVRGLLEDNKPEDILNDEPTLIFLDEISSAVEIVKNNPEIDLNSTFRVQSLRSSISIFLDSAAKKQFLMDALRYLECMMQVKRLNNCLKMQFLSV